MTTSTNRQKNVPVTETFYGYIETTRDSLLLFEACKRGLLPRITRRLQDKERILIRSGTIFCFDECESGIKRWTDGLVWSPSRILGNFLIYRELQDKKLMRSPYSTDSNMILDKQTARNNGGYVIAPDLLRRQQEKALVGSLKTSFKFKRNGLIKKSMSLIVDGVQQHIISYYSKEDVLSKKLRTPSSLVELSSLEVSPGLRLRQNFRIPAFQQDIVEGSSITDDDGSTQVTQERNNKRKYSDYKSPSPTSYTSSNSSIANLSSEPPSYSLQQENNLLFPLNEISSSSSSSSSPSSISTCSNKNKGKSRLYSLLPVLHHPSNSNTSYPGLESNIQQLSIDLPIHILDVPPPSIISNTPFVPSRSKSAEDSTNLSFQNAQLSNKKVLTDNIKANIYPSNTTTTRIHTQVARLPNHTNNISIDKNFSNTNYTTVSTNTTITNSNDYILTNNNMGLIASGGYYAPFKADNHYEGQNPHQHLFSSSSFHAINHASILPSRNTDITANAFMEDINILLGTGWNEFELQM